MPFLAASRPHRPRLRPGGCWTNCGRTGSRVIYLDSSALLKLVIEEPESAALDEWLSDRPAASVTSSELAKIEVIRGCGRITRRAVPGARRLLAGIDLIPLTGDLVEAATEIGDPNLRSLDALHLASAAVLGDAMAAFVAYDQRLTSAAARQGMPVVAPGA